MTSTTDNIRLKSNTVNKDTQIFQSRYSPVIRLFAIYTCSKQILSPAVLSLCKNQRCFYKYFSPLIFKERISGLVRIFELNNFPFNNGQ